MICHYSMYNRSYFYLAALKIKCIAIYIYITYDLQRYDTYEYKDARFLAVSGVVMEVKSLNW